jgi:pimeloyl-ACP methyl ester carboxylesterase
MPDPPVETGPDPSVWGCLKLRVDVPVIVVCDDSTKCAGDKLTRTGNNGWRMHRFAKHLVVCLILLLCGGTLAAAPATKPADVTPLVVYLPGISGLLWPGRQLGTMLRSGGFDSHYRVFDWTDGDPGLEALDAYSRNQDQAQDLANHLAGQRIGDPQRPIFLIAHSGGTGVAVWALEKLPKNVQVRGVILLASALSPDYDLSEALRHVSGKLIVFYSDRDQWILGAGTKVFGTIDRVRTEGAGLKGFHVPAGADADQYHKLIQVPYDRAWEALGNWGDHMGPLAGGFVRVVLAPLLRGLDK